MKVTQTIVLEKADYSDINEIEEIEKEFFTNYEKAFNYGFLDKWYKHNPDMFYVLRSEGLGIIGFMVLAPVTKALHEQILKGETFDFFDFPETEVMRTMDSDFYYLADICLTRKKTFNYLNAACILIGSLLKILEEKGSMITTCPITPDGESICHTLCMVKTAEVLFDGTVYPIYCAEINDKTLKRFRGMMKRATL